MQFPHLFLQLQLVLFKGVEFSHLLATDQIKLLIIFLVEQSQFCQFVFNGVPLSLGYLMIVFFYFLLLSFSRIIFIVCLAESFLQLDKVGVLLLVDLFTFDCILFKSFHPLLELNDFFLQSILGLFDFLILIYLQLLLLLFFQACQILDFLLVIFNSSVFHLNSIFQILNSSQINVYLSIWSRDISLALRPWSISLYMSICLQALDNSLRMLSICLLLLSLGVLFAFGFFPPLRRCFEIFLVSSSFCCLRASISSRLIWVNLFIFRSFSTSLSWPFSSFMFLSSRILPLIYKIIKFKALPKESMRKMPPLPNKKSVLNPPRPMMELVSNRISLPQRYNSIERAVRDAKKELMEEQEGKEEKEERQETSETLIRKNYLIRRPVSARQLSERRDLSKQSNRSKESRGSIEKSRQSPHYNKKMRMTMPSVSAHSWVLYEMREQKFLSGRSNFKRRQIASLTKIMNLVTILQICEINGLIPSKIRVNVTRQATTMIGTTAELRVGMELSLEDLFYGMMLPSGNDAAHQIAQMGGTILRMIQEGILDKQSLYSCEALSRLMVEEDSIVGLFIHEMNANSRKIGLTRSSWANPHGLSNVNNLSSAEDVAKLCMYCMKNTRFRQIVGTKQYSCNYYQQVEGELQKNWLKWENTNKLLWQGWDGIKTGITPNAGPCLAACTTRSISGRQCQFLVILINSESMEARWKEARELVDWIVADPTLLI